MALRAVMRYSGGAMGPQGPPGPNGPQGIAGPVGPQGIQGVPGSVGPQGPIGPEGPPGPVAPAGLNWRGLYSTSSTYAVNDVVSYGSPAASYWAVQPVPVSTPPTAGTSNAYWAFLSSEGPQGPQGPQGPPGAAGPQGVAGNTGTAGAQGPAGPQGAQGAPGPPGDFPDAPADGFLYGRQNASWAEINLAAGIPEAPADGRSYARDGLTTTWNPAVLIGGSTMTGPLVLSGDAPPGSGAQAVTYNQFNAAMNGMIATFMPFAGGQFTGPVTSVSTITTASGAPLTGAAGLLAGGGGISYVPFGALGQNIAWIVSAGAPYIYQNGVNVGGALATQTWVSGAYMPRSGGTFNGDVSFSTGPMLTLGSDPLTAMQAATKQYVDANAGGATVSDTAPAVKQGALWYDSTNLALLVSYNDGSSTQWVVANNQNALPDAPPDGTLYGRRTGAWSSVDAAITPAQHNVGRNWLHNPLFNVAQRGAGPWGITGYTADRWRANVSADTIGFSIVAQNDAGRAQIGDEASTSAFSASVTGTAGAGAFSALSQPIEKVQRLSGKTVTVSFYAYSGGSLKVGVNILQSFGTGGSPSASVWALATGQAVSTVALWTRYSVSIPMPSTASKTLGTNGDDCSVLWLWFSSGATNNANAGNIGVQSGTINLWGVQLEIGSVPTPLDYGGSVQQQLAQCQRFYQIAIASVRAYGSGPISMLSSISWPQMRAIPTVTLYGTGSRTNVTGVALTASQPWGGFLGCASVAAGDAYVLTDLYSLSADL